MPRLPIGKTIADTYRFAFGRYLPNLGVVWLPYLAIGLLGYWLLLPAMSASGDVLREAARLTQHPGAAPALVPGLAEMLRGIFLFEFLALLIFPVIAIGIAKEALGLRRSPQFVYLGIGRPEVVFFAGTITILVLYFVVVFLLAIIAGIGAAIFIATGGAANQDPATVIAKVTAIVRVLTFLAYLPLLYFGVRLGYLLAPISAAETRFGVWQSWKRTKGNFWRIFAVLLGTMLPLTILFYAVWFLVSGPGLFEYMWDSVMHPARAPGELAGQMDSLLRAMPYYWIVGLVLGPVSYGLLFGQSAIAYRALAPVDPATTQNVDRARQTPTAPNA